MTEVGESPVAAAKEMHSARLKSITPNADREVVECARVSSDANVAKRPDADLLSYLIRHQHWSPLEMASMCVEILTTRDVARQIIRHRSFSFQEFSQRYASAGILPPPVVRPARLQDPKNRQSSLPCDDEGDASWWAETSAAAAEHARFAYFGALNRGIAKEVARAVLPEGMTPSRLYMNGTIRSWIHYTALRSGPETQEEHQQVAISAAEVLAINAPIIWSALSKAGRE